MPQHNIVFVEKHQDFEIATSLSESMTKVWLNALRKFPAGIENYKVETTNGEGEVLAEETATHFLQETTG